MNALTRRAFFKTSALAAGAGVFSARSWAQVAGANGDIRVAVVGLNGRGKSHLASLAGIPGVRVVALCDVDSAVLANAKAALEAKGGSVRAFTDLRELLAARDIDVVTLATPNHLHSLQAIWACQAGKDVYVEKPVSHNVWEGRQLVAAARKYQRVVQAGTQIRSGDGMCEAVEWVRAGHLGKITVARGFCYKRRDSIGRTRGPQTIPASVDYDLWCGPAPKDRLFREKLHYDWHWQYVTGNGDVGNQGIHQMDVARWFLGESGLPRSTVSIGGRLGYLDDGDTPNTQIVLHDYPAAPLIFEVRGLPGKAAKSGKTNAKGKPVAVMDKYRGVSIGNIIDCAGGHVEVADYFSARAYDRAGKLVKEFQGKDRHMANFIDVVRSRKVADLRGPIEEGHLSSALCHLGNISHQLGAPVESRALFEKARKTSRLVEPLQRMADHLAGNGVDLNKTPLTFGLALTLEPGAERFTGPTSAQANPLLTRDYRARFAVPDLTGAA